MKSYPFSVAKHQHDIEFRYNRISNEISDVQNGNLVVDDDTYYKMVELQEKLDEIRSYVFGAYPVCYIPSNLYGLAIETVEWAHFTRSERRSNK